MCLPALCLKRMCLFSNDWNEWVNIKFLFWCQMKESIMNQEKLAKLQAQVRIGGKVSRTTCWLMFYFWVFILGVLFMHYISLLCSVGVSPQKEEGGAQNSNSRWQEAAVLPQETGSQQHLWHWGGTEIFFLKCTAILDGWIFFMRDTRVAKRDWKFLIVIK